MTETWWWPLPAETCSLLTWNITSNKTIVVLLTTNPLPVFRTAMIYLISPTWNWLEFTYQLQNDMRVWSPSSAFENTVFWYVTPLSVVYVHQRFERTCCLCLKKRRSHWRKHKIPFEDLHLPYWTGHILQDDRWDKFTCRAKHNNSITLS